MRSVNDDTYYHILWLAKLNTKQLRSVAEFIKCLLNNDFWDGVSKHNVKSLIQSYADKVDRIV